MYLVLGPAAIAMLLIHRFADVAQFGFVYAAIILIVLLWCPFGTNSRPLVFLGEIAYTLYVVHEFIGFVIILHLVEAGWSRWVATGLAIAVVLALATLLTKYVD